MSIFFFLKFKQFFFIKYFSLREYWNNRCHIHGNTFAWLSGRNEWKIKNGSDYFSNDLVCLFFTLYPVWITQQGWLNMQLKRNTVTNRRCLTVCISLPMWKFKAGKKQSPQVVTDNENIVFIFHFVWLIVVLMFIFFSLTSALHADAGEQGSLSKCMDFK